MLLDKIQPLILRLRHKLMSYDGTGENVSSIRDIYTLCSSQINKCLINLFDVFKLEVQYETTLQVNFYVYKLILDHVFCLKLFC